MTGNPRKVVTPTYDSISRLQELKVDNQIQMSEINYNPMSQVTQLKTGAATGNADVEQYSYDGQTGLLTNQKVLKASNNQSLLDLSYEYNRGSSKGNLNGKTGQLTHIVDNLNRNKDRVFEFDTLGRLSTAKGGGATGVGGVTANWTQNYSFDRYGNRTNVSASGITQNSQNVPTDGSPTQSYDNATNRITTAGYLYDLTGNMIRGQKPDGTWQWFEYDAANRLVNVFADNNGTKGSNVQGSGYGSSRQRVVTNEGGVLKWYVWGGSSVIAEYTATSWGSTYDWAKSYIYAGSRLLSTFTKNGASETLEFHHPDRLGTRLVTNNSANTSFEQNTLPFGTALDAESTGSTNQRFTSYDRSTVAQLDYAVNRSYSSGQGRFTSVDPIGAGASLLIDPQSTNLYTYTQNNPIDFVDPSGLDDITPDEPTEPIAIVDVTAEPEDAFMSDDWQRFLRDSLELRGLLPMPEPIDVGNVGVVNITADPDPVTTTTGSVTTDIVNCWVGAYLKNNPDVKTAIDNAWNKSGYSTNKSIREGMAKEQGGAIAIKNGIKSYNRYLRKAGDSRVELNLIPLVKELINAGATILLMYHTHPFEAGDIIKELNGRIKDPNIPSPDGDKPNALMLGVYQIIATSNYYLGYDADTKKWCQISK